MNAGGGLMRGLAAALLLATAGTAAQAQPAPASAADAPWQFVGRQGIVRLVIVPDALVRDEAAYHRQIALICPADQTCFVNFFANPDKLALDVPLPDAVQREATVVFRRSLKQGAELFSWSCRLQMNAPQCF